MTSSTHLERVVADYSKLVEYSIAVFINLINQIKQTIDTSCSESAEEYNNSMLDEALKIYKDNMAKLIYEINNL